MPDYKKQSKDVTIIGGGITGLASAYMAARAGKSVRVIESSKQFGGLLNTFEVENTRLEFYYHHFFTHDAELNWLIRELKIEDKLFFKQSTMGVFREGKIYPFNNIRDLLLFEPIRFFGKIRFGLSSLFLGKVANWRKFEGISSIDWLYTWAGKNTTDILWRPLLNIKFGPFAKVVPLSWLIGRLKQRMSSRKNGDERLGYLKGSLQVLLDALLARLIELDVELITESPVERAVFKDARLISVISIKGEFHSNQFLFTIPGSYLAPIIKNEAPELALALSNIAYFGAVCTVLELDRPLSNIYWLNIASDGFPFGGIIEHTNFVDSTSYDGTHITYLSRYFAQDEAIAAMNNEEIKDLMIEALPRIYKDFERKWIKKVSVFRTNTAATVCELDFSRKVPKCKTEIENLFVSNMSHIYPDERSTNNSIRIAAEACRVMGINTDYVPLNSSLSGQIGF